MPRQFSRTVSALVLVLAAGAAAPGATPAGLAVLKAQEPARTHQAQTHLRSIRSQLGLGESSDFQVQNVLTNEQGRTIVRFRQTHLGHPVWSGSAIVHVGSDGAVQRVIPGLAAGIELTGVPDLTPDQAAAIAVQNLAPKGPLAGAPKVTQVVFPSHKTGGYVTKVDPTTGRLVLDRDMSIWAKRPAADYVWAYEVKTALMNARDGMKQMVYIVDGDTGAILRKWDDLRSDTSAQGTGNSYYNGIVSLTTTQSSTDGTFAMVDPIRGTVPNIVLGTVGLTSVYHYYTYDPIWGSFEAFGSYAGNGTNAWGDGLIFGGSTVYTDPAGDYWWAGAEGPNGQTSAVDAQFGMATAWDLFLHVFGRNGMDNLGGTLVSVVHPFASETDGSLQKWDSHKLNTWQNMIFLGDGTYPSEPDGKGAQTEIDIVGHEMAHSFADALGFIEAGESGAIEEATSDIFGKVTQAYALRAPGSDGTIPDFPTSSLTHWAFGYNANRGNPERYLYKPSLDNVSPDGWYDGISGLDCHYSGGPLNRMFFFLANGASSTDTDPAYSIYMPAGMTGIGIDRAARIWYKAVTEYLLSTSAIEDALPAAVQAATDLYGATSGEVAAVQNAFYAVNIGDAPGQPKHVRITFPVLHAAGTVLGDGGAWFKDAQIQFFAPHTPVTIQVDVQNTNNTAVTWSLGSNRDGLSGGTINSDGTWTTPAAPSFSWYQPFVVVATSQADTTQFGKGAVLIVDIDADQDAETDALDLGQIAMTWGLNYSLNPYKTTCIWTGWDTGDGDVALFDEVLTDTWPAK